MVRKKVNLAWITDDTSRRATFKKRRNGLLKKMREMSTLCDVEACAVIYEPYKVQPEVWPSESKVKDTLLRFKSMPETEQSKKRMDQVGFLKQQNSKLEEQIRKQHLDNLELQMKIFINEAVEGRRSLRDDVRIQESTIRLERLMEETLEVVKAAKEGKKKKRLLMNLGGTASNHGPSDEKQKQLLKCGISFDDVGGLEDVMMGPSYPHINIEGSAWMDLSFDSFSLF